MSQKERDLIASLLGQDEEVNTFHPVLLEESTNTNIDYLSTLEAEIAFHKRALETHLGESVRLEGSSPAEASKHKAAATYHSALVEEKTLGITAITQLPRYERKVVSTSQENTSLIESRAQAFAKKLSDEQLKEAIHKHDTLKAHFGEYAESLLVQESNANMPLAESSIERGMMHFYIYSGYVKEAVRRGLVEESYKKLPPHKHLIWSLEREADQADKYRDMLDQASKKDGPRSYEHQVRRDRWASLSTELRKKIEVLKSRDTSLSAQVQKTRY